MSRPEHHVRIGHIIMTTNGEILKTVLGSCVGIALIWKKQGKCVLAHCLLPEPLNTEKSTEARYVSQAVPRMLEILGIGKGDLDELEAIVAGGGQMMDVEQPYVKFVVGTENLRIAKKILESLKIRIIAFEPGGEQGTKMRLDGRTGEFEVERIPRAA